MKNTTPLTLALGGLALSLLAACGSSTDASSSSSSVPDTSAQVAKFKVTPTTLPITTALSKKPPTGVEVDFLQNGQTPGQQYSAALRGAAQVLGWTVKDIPFDLANPATVGSAFQTAVNGGAKVIAVQGLDAALYERFMPLAQAKHIIVIDTVSSGKSVPGVTYVDRSDTAGKPVADIAVNAILADAHARKVTPHVLTVGSVVLRSLLTPTINDIKADIKAAHCSGCSSELYELSAQAFASNAVAAPVVSYLQAHPKVNYLFVSNGALSTGLLSAIKQAGLGASIRLVGATPLPPQIEELKSGNRQNLGWIANSITVVGWMSMDAAARVMVGDDASAYAHVAAPTWLLTKDSGSQLVPSPVAPKDFATQFATMWKLGS